MLICLVCTFPSTLEHSSKSVPGRPLVEVWSSDRDTLRRTIRPIKWWTNAPCCDKPSFLNKKKDDYARIIRISRVKGKTLSIGRRLNKCAHRYQLTTRKVQVNTLSLTPPVRVFGALSFEQSEPQTTRIRSIEGSCRFELERTITDRHPS